LNQQLLLLARLFQVEDVVLRLFLLLIVVVPVVLVGGAAPASSSPLFHIFNVCLIFFVFRISLLQKGSLLQHRRVLIQFRNLQLLFVIQQHFLLFEDERVAEDFKILALLGECVLKLHLLVLVTHVLEASLDGFGQLHGFVHHLSHVLPLSFAQVGELHDLLLDARVDLRELIEAELEGVSHHLH